MNSVIVLCVGMMGAANPANGETNNQPVQVAYADYGIANGGCYRQPGYQSPVAQYGGASYATEYCNCTDGSCGQYGCSGSCPNGQCAPSNYTANYRAGTAANCSNGQCQLNGRYSSTGAQCYGPNCPQQTRSNYSPPRDTGFHTLPVTRYPSRGYTQPRSNPYSTPRTYDVNWTNSSRPVQPRTYQNSNSTSPYFN